MFGGVLWFGFFLGLALFFDVGAVFAEFLEFLWGAEIGEAFFEEIADGGFDLFFDAAVFVGGRAVRNWGMGFGDALEGFGRMVRVGVRDGRLGGLMAEGVDLVAEDHELALERLELLVDGSVGAGRGGQAGAMGAVRSGWERMGLLGAVGLTRALRGVEGTDELAEFHGFIGMAFGFFGAGHLFDVGDGARGDGGGGLRGVGATALLGARGVAGREVELVWGAFARA